MSGDTDITFLSYYQKDEGGSTYQFLPVQGLLYPTPYGYIDRDTFLGEPDWNTYDREQWAVGYDLNHYFNDVWSFRQNLKYSYVDTLFRTVVSNPRLTVDNGGLNGDNRTFPRRGVKGEGDLRSIQADNQFKARFRTGGLSHEFIKIFTIAQPEKNYSARLSTGGGNDRERLVPFAGEPTQFHGAP